MENKHRENEERESGWERETQIKGRFFSDWEKVKMVFSY